MFKVGDNVTCIDDFRMERFIEKGKRYTVQHISVSLSMGDSYLILRDGMKTIEGEFLPTRFKLTSSIPNKLDPVITVPARRELKAGIYGKVILTKPLDGSNTIGLTVANGKPPGPDFFTVDDLDELIFTLTQVREFLKDG